MKRLAIITARGGSKRIPKKNIKEFCGKPIISYSIEAALESGLFSEVMVSTDSMEIAELSKTLGASVPFMRSEETAGDYATTAEVIQEVLEVYEKQKNCFSTICCLYPTAPFVTAEKLINAVQLLEENKYDSVMPVAEFSFPPLRGMVIREERLSYRWEEFAKTRSQDLEPIYHDVGQFYVFTREAFLRTGKLVTENTGALVVSPLEMQDIDRMEDWMLAEAKYQLLSSRSKEDEDQK